MSKFERFDVVDYLDNEEVIAEYLTAAMEDPNPDMFLRAVSDVASARGMTKMAQDSGLGRESLYKAQRPGSKPRYETMRNILAALHVKIKAVPATPHP